MLELCIDFFKSIHWHCLSEPVDRVRVMGIQGTKNPIFLKKMRWESEEMSRKTDVDISLILLPPYSDFTSSGEIYRTINDLLNTRGICFKN